MANKSVETITVIIEPVHVIIPWSVINTMVAKVRTGLNITCKTTQIVCEDEVGITLEIG